MLPSIDAAILAVVANLSAPLAGSCPDDMVLVSGNYCPDVAHHCERLLDPKTNRFARCAVYRQPAECRSEHRVPMRFCIGRTEYTSPGSRLPLNHRHFEAAQRICAETGKRLCTEAEWTFACEGESMRPYPYGWRRSQTACNADHIDITTRDGKLKDLREPGGSYPECRSPFGVLDMTGNLEELVVRQDRPWRPSMKGAHWLPGRNHCRARQTIHGPLYSGMEVGFRCCSEPIDF